MWKGRFQQSAFINQHVYYSKQCSFMEALSHVDLSVNQTYKTSITELYSYPQPYKTSVMRDGTNELP